MDPARRLAALALPLLLLAGCQVSVDNDSRRNAENAADDAGRAAGKAADDAGRAAGKAADTAGNLAAAAAKSVEKAADSVDNKLRHVDVSVRTRDDDNNDGGKDGGGNSARQR
ncbi:MAG: hypothetical protein JO013_02425 [Alphaproteobacteria bacterium]|nr:hypothetical protein [Alphaproteobacteria bacterium]